ncbi:PQQ-dependent sugar dehydrogenase, partial [Streptomyces alkaliphilus]|uniref:PQQ-dependent sugar dehydrogenase n=1 Tax=Streptomyces alkaliphilus TaxID=1472722 RepID=UPI001E4956C9
GGDAGGEPVPEPEPTEPPPPPAEGSAEVVGTVALPGIQAPVGPAVLPDGDLLVGSRTTGTIHRVSPDTGDITEVGTVRAVEAGGAGGLLALAADETYVHAYYTTVSDARIMRFGWDEQRPAGDQLTPGQRVLPGLPDTPGTRTGGLFVTPDGDLYAGVGGADGTEGPVGTVMRFAGRGSAASPETLSSGWETVDGLATDTVGRLWLTGRSDGGEALVIGVGTGVGGASPTDDVLHRPGDGGSPVAMAYAEGSLWVVTDAGELLRLPLAGTRLYAEPEEFDLPGGTTPAGIADAGEGNLWVLDTGPSGEPGGAGDRGRLLRLGIE